MTSLVRPAENLPVAQGFTPEQIDLIKSTVAAGTTDLELALFLEVAKSTGLNPFQRQVYAIKRKSGNDTKMTIQTGIDGYRLIAARSGVHLGTSDAEFGPVTAEGFPEYARVIVRKLVQGQVAEFPATARWSEYVQTKDEWKNNQRTGNKIVGDMWAKMPHTMLGKCAEALALRKAFPAELSGVYSDVEMAQADNAAAPVQQETKTTPEPEQTPPPTNEKALQAWAKKIGDMAERVRKVAPTEEVTIILDMYSWRSDVEAARATYEELKELGKQHASVQEKVKSDPDVVEGELKPDLITDAQRGTLMAHLKRGGLPDNSETRSQFYTWFTNGAIHHPTRTNELTSEQARALLVEITTLDTDALAQAVGEFLKAVAA